MSAGFSLYSCSARTHHAPTKIPPSHSTANCVNGLLSPPLTPSTSLHGNLSSFGPSAKYECQRVRSWATVQDWSRVYGTELDLSEFKKGLALSASPAFTSNTNGSSDANRKSYVRLETDAKKKRIAEVAEEQATNGS